jgi:hypothetical protein
MLAVGQPARPRVNVGHRTQAPRVSRSPDVPPEASRGSSTYRLVDLGRQAPACPPTWPMSGAGARGQGQRVSAERSELRSSGLDAERGAAIPELLRDARSPSRSPRAGCSTRARWWAGPGGRRGRRAKRAARSRPRRRSRRLEHVRKVAPVSGLEHVRKVAPVSGLGKRTSPDPR